MKFTTVLSTLGLGGTLTSLIQASPTPPLLPPPLKLPLNPFLSPRGGQGGGDSDITPPTTTEFSLVMLVDNTNVSLTATYLDVDNIVLQAGSLSVSPGTPAYTNQTSTTTSQSGYNTSVVLDLTSSTDASMPAGVYGLSVPDLGEVYGASASVFAEESYQEFEFDVSDGEIFHQLTAAPQSFFACNMTIDEETNYYLKWGVYNEDLAPPTNCTYTRVFQNFNVPGGATS